MKNDDEYKKYKEDLENSLKVLRSLVGLITQKNFDEISRFVLEDWKAYKNGLNFAISELSDPKKK